MIQAVIILLHLLTAKAAAKDLKTKDGLNLMIQMIMLLLNQIMLQVTLHIHTLDAIVAKALILLDTKINPMIQMAIVLQDRLTPQAVKAMIQMTLIPGNRPEEIIVNIMVQVVSILLNSLGTTEGLNLTTTMIQVIVRPSPPDLIAVHQATKLGITVVTNRMTKLSQSHKPKD